MPTTFSTRPVYAQLHDVLVERITSGVWKPGDALPSEDDLAHEFGVAKGTMRRALTIMEQEQLITRRQGRGTFVNDHSSESLAVRFYRLYTRDGKPLLAETTTGHFEHAPANDAERSRLHLEEGDSVYRIKRARIINQVTFLLEEAALPAKLFAGLDKVEPVPHRIASIAQRYGIAVGKADERITLEEASPTLAATLGVAPGAPLAMLDRIMWGIDGQPFEWRVAWCDLTKHYYMACID